MPDNVGMYFQVARTNVRVLGSMHQLPPGGGLPSWVTEAYAWADDLIFEIDPVAVKAVQFVDRSGQLKRAVSAELWQWLEKVWNSSVDTMPPWVAMTATASRLQDTVEGVEGVFARQVRKDQKGADYLEIPAELVALFDEMPLGEIRGSLELMMRDPGGPRRSLSALYGAWVRRNVAAFCESVATAPWFQYPGIRECILHARNRAWAPRLSAKLSASRRTLVVVGALHLCGAGNLLELLGAETSPVAG